jgi:aminopeptidase N
VTASARTSPSRLRSRSMLLVAGALSATLVGLTLPAQAAPPNPGRGSDPYLTTGETGVNVLNYNVVLSYDARTHGLATSSASISAVAGPRLTSFVLDMSQHLAVVRVVVNGRAASKLVHTNNKLTVTPAVALAAGKQFNVTIQYRGTPGSHPDTSGRGPVGWVRTAGGAATFTEPDGTHEWVPSDDVLYDKATWTVQIKTLNGVVGVSTGRLAKQTTTTSGANKILTTTWVQDQPITPYQQMVAIDSFNTMTRTINGIRSFVAVTKIAPKGSPNANGNTMSARTSAAITWLTSRLGTFPYADTGAIVVSGGDTAMETAGRPTYSNDSPYDYAPATVVHELAHQWFGGRFTARNTADLWLQEGFATWLERDWQSEQKGGTPLAEHIRANYLRDGFLNNGKPQFGSVSVQAPTNAFRLESTVYYRGAAAIEALRVQLGDSMFWKLLRGVVNQPAGRTFTTDQFVAMASQLSGTDLSGWRARWLASKDVQPLPQPATAQQTADEIAHEVGQAVYFGGSNTVTPQDLSSAVAQARADDTGYVPLRYLVAGSTSSGTAGSVAVTRINLTVAAGPLYGARVNACLTIPTDISNNYGAAWFNQHAPLSTTFTADTITLSACP